MIVLFRRQTPNKLTSEQRFEVDTLIEQYPEVLSSLPGRTDQIQHDIKLLTGVYLFGPHFDSYQSLNRLPI